MSPTPITLDELRQIVRLIRHYCGEHNVNCERFTDQQIADFYMLQMVGEEPFGPVDHMKLYMSVVPDIAVLNERNLLL